MCPQLRDRADRQGRTYRSSLIPGGSLGRRDPTNAKTLVIEGNEVATVLARLLFRPLLALLAVAVVAAIGLARHGPGEDYRLLVLGSLGSAICLPAHSLLAFVPHGRRSWLLLGLALGGLPPYLFGLYLFFYRGLWGMTDLGRGSPVDVLLRTGLCVIAGFSVVRGTYLVTEFTKAVSDGTIETPKPLSRPPEVLALLAGLVDPDAMVQLEESIARLAPESACWCGSGSRFQGCHRGRDKEARLGIEDLRRSIERTMRRHRRACLHPRAGSECSSPGTFAHSIQLAELRKIATKGHVLGFTPSLPERLRDGRFEPRLIGIKDASTFTGFCNRHDSDAFTAVETAPFSGSDEQLFLLSYRALCLELFAKEWAILRLLPTMRLADRGQPISVQIGIQARIAMDEIGKRGALTFTRQEKERYDEVLLGGDYAQFRYLAFGLRDAPELACTGALVPRGDFAGTNRAGLSDLCDLLPPMFTIAPTTSGGVAMLGWLGESPSNSELVRTLAGR